MGFAVNRRRIRLTDGGWIDHTRTSHIQHPRRKQERTCSAIGHGSESYSCSCSYIIPKLHSNNCYILQMSPDSFHSAVYVRSKHTNNTECCSIFPLCFFFVVFIISFPAWVSILYSSIWGRMWKKKHQPVGTCTFNSTCSSGIFFAPFHIYFIRLFYS